MVAPEVLLARIYLATRTLVHCRWECNMIKPFWKTFWQLKYVLFIWPSSPTPGYLEKWKLIYKDLLYTNVHSRSIGNYQQLETTNCPSVNEWDKQIVLYPYNGWTTDMLNNMNKSLCIMLSEKARHKRLHPMWFHFYVTLEKAKL